MMKKVHTTNRSDAVSVISGDDGPTSIFLLRNDSKTTLRQNLQKNLYGYRKKRTARSLKANPHTMDQVTEYARNKWGYADIDRDSEEYQTEYRQMRASFLLQYKSELLGEWKDYPQLEGRDPDNMKRFLTSIDQMQNAAANVPTELFDIDLCILEKNSSSSRSRLIFEKTYGYIGSSASGSSQKEMQAHRRIYRDIYRYYGVAQEDIDHQTRRYEEVLGVLAAR